ncbi:MAG: methyltransferase domain-containing protein [Actinomycetota bacterium]|nr:methyltransferase domain-containing protein [Actinomycetota bacterium]
MGTDPVPESRRDRLDLLLGRRRARRWLEDAPDRQGVRAVVRTAVRGRPTVGLRRLLAEGRLPLAAIHPRLRRALDVDGGRVSPLRVEIGGGPSPSPGYVHVDADPRSAHLEHVALAWALPFETGTVEEILAVHVLEHVPPGYVIRTLREWLRVLQPGGCLQVHVPDARSIMTAYLEGSSEIKWAAISAIYGAPADLGLVRPGDETGRRRWSEHQVLYDFDLAREALELSGFDDVEDASGRIVDDHTAAWQHLIPSMSMVVRARRPT